MLLAIISKQHHQLLLEELLKMRNAAGVSHFGHLVEQLSHFKTLDHIRKSAYARKRRL